MINFEHMDLYRQALPILFAAPRKTIMIMGCQDIDPKCKDEYPFDRVLDLFKSKGFTGNEIDLFDHRADLGYNLSFTLPSEHYGRYGVVFDIGTIEHVADSQTVLNTYDSLLAIPGLLFLLTPIKGYYRHGLYTFSEQYIVDTFVQSNYQLVKKWYVDKEGPILQSPDDADDVLLVVILKKVVPCGRLQCVTQPEWRKWKYL